MMHEQMISTETKTMRGKTKQKFWKERIQYLIEKFTRGHNQIGNKSQQIKR